MNLLRITCLLLVFAPAVASAQNSRWFAKVWQTEDGLPNNTVASIAQTPDGFLWLGTPIGLVRFDGLDFQRVLSTNFVQGNRGILNLISLRDGGLALGMDRGAVVLLRSNSVVVLAPGREVPDSVPFSMVEDREGAVWLSYRSGSVFRIDGGRVTQLVESIGEISPRTMCALIGDRDGRVWYSVNGELGIMEEGKPRKLHELPSHLTRLAPCGEGGVWIVSGNQILKATASGALQKVAEFGSANSSPLAAIEDRNGGIWIGSAVEGLFYFDGTRVEAVAASHKEVTCLLQDHEGGIWAGTTGAGLNQIRAQVVELEGAAEGLPFEAVQSICEDAEGVFWAATQNGALARRVAGRWQTFVPDAGWRAQAYCVAADPKGGIWIGTRSSGLFFWKDGQLHPWGNTNELVGRTIHALEFSPTGELWIGESSPDAVQCLKNGQLTTFAVPAEARVIRAMARAADGSVWVGASRGSLLRVKDGRLSDETSRTFVAESIRCVYAASNGVVWIGYAGDGLGRIQNGRFTNIRTEHGLYDDYISQIVADGHGWVWFGGDRGIFKVREKELQDFAGGRVRKVRSIHYGRGEGLPSLQATFGAVPGAWLSRDGRIWMPMRTALAVIDPERVRINSEPPPVFLDRVLVDDFVVARNPGVIPEPKAMGAEVINLRDAKAVLRLPPGHQSVQFDFTAPSFKAPENVRFRYRLEGEGFKNDWVETTKERSATYLRLPAGSYRFRVVAGNSDDVWNETGVTLGVVVTPFFWQTWWFRIFVLTVFTALVIAVVRYVSFRRLRLQLRRLEQQEALYKERARIAKDIHDDVGANLTQIALLGDLVKQDGGVEEKVGAKLERISNTARQAVKSLDEIVWAVNPRNDTLAHLIDYTGQFALDYLRVAGIRCRLDLPEQVPAREISTDVRHNLFLVVKEALNNIVKHARATEVWLRIHSTDTHLRMAVEDDGIGFDAPSNAAEADGLKNMQQRIADIGGTCRIESQAPGGTKVLVELPWNS